MPRMNHIRFTETKYLTKITISDKRYQENFTRFLIYIFYGTPQYTSSLVIYSLQANLHSESCSYKSTNSN